MSEDQSDSVENQLDSDKEDANPTVSEVVTYTVPAKVSKEAHEVGLALRVMMIKADEALEDGKISSDEILTGVMASFSALKDAIADIKKVKGEFKNEPLSAINGVYIPVAEGIEALIK